MWFPPELLRIILRHRTLLHWRERLFKLDQLLCPLLSPVEEMTLYLENGLLQHLYKTDSSWFLITQRADGVIIKSKRFLSIKVGALGRKYRSIYW